MQCLHIATAISDFRVWRQPLSIRERFTGPAASPFTWEDATITLERIPAFYCLWWGMKVKLWVHSTAVPDNGCGGYWDKTKACWHQEGWNCQKWLWWKTQIFPRAGKEAKIRNETITLICCDLLSRLVSLEGIYLVRLSVYQNYWSKRKTNPFGTHIEPSWCSASSSSWHIRNWMSQSIRRE